MISSEKIEAIREAIKDQIKIFTRMMEIECEYFSEPLSKEDLEQINKELKPEFESFDRIALQLEETSTLFNNLDTND